MTVLNETSSNGHKVKIISLVSGLSGHGGDGAVVWMHNPKTKNPYGYEEIASEVWPRRTRRT